MPARARSLLRGGVTRRYAADLAPVCQVKRQPAAGRKPCFPAHVVPFLSERSAGFASARGRPCGPRLSSGRSCRPGAGRFETRRSATPCRRGRRRGRGAAAGYVRRPRRPGGVAGGSTDAAARRVRREPPVGFALAHALPRRHGDPTKLLVYEIDVAESHQRCGIGSALLAQLAELARERGIRTEVMLTEPDNGPANALYGAPAARPTR